MTGSGANPLAAGSFPEGSPGTPLRPGVRLMPQPPLVEAKGVTRNFGRRLALDGVSLAVGAGEIHALLGPNGAGKTTLLRTLTGLTVPSAGTVRVIGMDATRGDRAARAATGLVPSGDRTFYLRISGLENLVFFARLHGMRRSEARERALEMLATVGLGDAARLPVAAYSHGMQKRLSLARALLTRPRAMLVDEATHDLDPEAAAGVRNLVRGLADEGAAVLWTTQRIEEIRGFADAVTLLAAGRVRFAGSVAALIATAEARRFVLRLSGALPGGAASALARIAGPGARLERLGAIDPDHFVLSLEPGSILGDAVARLAAAGVEVLDCRRERSEIEEAFVTLSRAGGAG